MKKIICLLLSGFLGILYSCDKNDPFSDLGQVISKIPNVYMASVSPMAKAGSVVTVDIQYWEENDDFDFSTQMGLFYRVDSTVYIEFDLAPASLDYRFIKEFSGRKIEESLYKKVEHDFTKWDQDKRAYVISVEYEIDNNLKSVEVDQGDVVKSEYVNSLPSDIDSVLCHDLVNSLNKSQLKILLVDTQSVISGDELDALYDEEGDLTGSGQEVLLNKLKEIPLADMVGETYQLKDENDVVLIFKVANSQGVYGESSPRSIAVQ